MVQDLTLLDRWGNASYNDARDWKNTLQPLAGTGASINEYTEIAHRSVGDLEQQLAGFFDRHGFSYVQINHSEFKETFEPTGTNFRDWLEQQCEKYGLDPHVDLLLVGPCVKDIASSERKMHNHKNSSDDIRDYLRAMVVVLKTKQTSKAKHKHGQSFSVFERLMTAIEHDEANIPYKNQLWSPHEKTGFRGFKARWTANDSEEPLYQILSEVKFQHETQMDIDKLTRAFLAMTRSRLRLQNDFPEMNPSRRGYMASKEADEQANFIRNLSVILYNRVHADAGFNHRFLNPALAVDYSPHDFYAIDAFIHEHLPLFNAMQQKSMIKKLAASEIFPRSSPYSELHDTLSR